MGVWGCPPALRDAGICISHPSLDGHPSYELARQLFKKGLYPSVFTVTVSCASKKSAIKVLKNCRSVDLDYKTSFGSATSRVDPWPTFKDGER